MYSGPSPYDPQYGPGPGMSYYPSQQQQSPLANYSRSQLPVAQKASLQKSGSQKHSSTKRHHKHKPRSSPSLPSSPGKPTAWEQFACWASGNDPLSGFCASKRRRRRQTKPIEFYDDDVGRISLGSQSDWDEMEANEKAWGHAKGPKKERAVDDLMITFADLFPCCSTLFEKCGLCSDKRPKKRMMIRPREAAAAGPKLETVCLECGNVLNALEMPKSIAMDMIDRNMGGGRLPGPGPLAIERSGIDVNANKYEGYKEWQVPQTLPTRKSFVPLPSFQAAPTRYFGNQPGQQDPAKCAHNDYFDVDQTGHVTLPDFPEETFDH